MTVMNDENDIMHKDGYNKNITINEFNYIM